MVWGGGGMDIEASFLENAFCIYVQVPKSDCLKAVQICGSAAVIKTSGGVPDLYPWQRTPGMHNAYGRVEIQSFFR